MKKLLIFLFAVCFVVACNSEPKTAAVSAQNTPKNSNILVAYFSATGNTRKVAENLSKATGGDIYEIKPQTLYTSEDLDWTNPNSRSSVEMKSQTARPAIVPENLTLSNYDTIYLGFPIWWGTAPVIVRTFLEKYDFSNKKIIIFATSGSSGIGNIDNDLKTSVSPTAKIVKGAVLNNKPSVEYLRTWSQSFK